jgi:uncharacterized protein (TIGR03435 family)
VCLDSSHRVPTMFNPRSLLLDSRRTLSLIGISISLAVTSVGSQVGNGPGATTADGSAAVRPDLAFDVVSIRPVRDTGDRFFSTTGNEYRAIGAPLRRTILWAYFPIRMASKDSIIGAPSWVSNESYEFIGKVGEADLPDWQHFSQRGLLAPNPMLQIMLQHALADRCKLVIHRVPGQMNGFALVVGKHGPNRKNLVESKPDDVIPGEAVSIALGGRMVGFSRHDDPVLHFYQTSMASLTLEISDGAPIEDRTGLSGKYKFDLTRLGTDGIPTSDWDLAPLGLKLIPTKIPTEQILIDHIERPSPN